jgi:hypothetical protein
LSNFVGGGAVTDVLETFNPIKIASFIAPHLEGDQSITQSDYDNELKIQQQQKDAQAQAQQDANLVKNAQAKTDAQLAAYKQQYEKRTGGPMPDMMVKEFLRRADSENAKAAMTGGDLTGFMRGLIGLPPTHEQQLQQLRDSDLTQGYVPKIDPAITYQDMGKLLKRGGAYYRM